MSDTNSENPVVDDTVPAPGAYQKPDPNAPIVTSETGEFGSDLPDAGTGTPADPTLPWQGNDSSS